MDMKLALIAIIIFGLLLIALVVTIIVFVKSRNKWMLNSQNQYLKGKEDGKTEAISIINATINSIENDKNKLNQMSEKELMVSTMMALASYGRRLDETNARLQSINDYKIYISEMNKQMQALSCSYENLQNTVKTAEASLAESIMNSQTRLNETVDSSRKSIESFNATATVVSGNIDTLNSRLSTVGDIRQRIDVINSDLNQSLELLRSLQIQSSSIMSEMNEMLESYGQSPIAKLDAINHNVSVIFDWVEETHRRFKELYDKFEDVDESDLSDLEKIEEIYDGIRRLCEKFEYVNTSDLQDLYKIDNIESTVSNIESKLNCSELDSIYDINSKLSDVDSKLSDIESKLSDIECRVN